MANLKDENTEDYVYVSLGITKNLGNYESMRIDASYRRSIRVDETIEEAYADAWKVVDEQLEAQITEADTALEEAKS